jgi:hypothetical protein
VLFFSPFLIYLPTRYFCTFNKVSWFAPHGL